MRTRNKSKTPAAATAQTVTFDRAHLVHYTMENRELEQEIVTLFLHQLPETLNMLKSAKKPVDWKLAAHTLKGSAAAVGAARINALAVKIERCSFGKGPDVSEKLLVELDRAVDEFRKATDRIYG